MLHEFGGGAGHHHARTFRGFLHTRNHNAYAFADRKRLETRLLFASHAGFRFANVEDDIGAFDALHSRIDNLADVTDVFVVNRVALGLADLLKNDLLGELSRNATEDSLRNFRDQQFAAEFCVGIELASLIDRDLQVGIFNLLGSLHDRFDRVGIDLAAVFVEHGPQVFLRLIVLAGGDDNGILDRADHNARIDALLTADPF